MPHSGHLQRTAPTAHRGRARCAASATNAADDALDHYKYGYDRAGSRIWRENPLHGGLDELYGHDGLHRLNDFQRGDLNAGKTAIASNLNRRQAWGLDILGNWATFNEDDDGDSTDDLVQARQHNAVNEIDTDNTHGDADNPITQTTGPAWIDPIHDAAGNMTKAPRPGDEADAADALLLVYDAWNRLVRVYDDNDADGNADAGELIVTETYDGLGRRITTTTTARFDIYYNSAWQILEFRRPGSNTYECLWDLRYIDAPIVRWKDGNADGDLLDAGDHIEYFTNDANMNVTALIARSGSVTERYRYDPYGRATVMDATWGDDGLPDTYNHFQHQGTWVSSTTGLHTVRYRIGHPTFGRWMQRDRIGYADGMNLLAAYHVMWGGWDPDGERSLLGAIRQGIGGIFYIGFRQSLDAKLVYGQEATKWANINGKDEDERNALRHCVWAALLHRNMSEEDADEALLIHEAVGDMDSCDARRDFWNNAIGKRIGEGSDKIHRACWRAFKDGDLAVTIADAKRLGACKTGSDDTSCSTGSSEESDSSDSSQSGSGGSSDGKS